MFTKSNDGYFRCKFWTKQLKIPLRKAAVERLHQLDDFRVAAEGYIFRSVHYRDANQNCLLMERVRGLPVSRILVRSGKPLASPKICGSARTVAGLAGRWLAYFHQWQTNGEVPFYDTGARAQRAIDNIEVLCRQGLSPELGKRLADYVQEASCESADRIAVTAHGDFKPSNLLIGSKEVVGVDMESYVRAHPLFDISQFVGNVMISRSGALLGTGQLSWWRTLCRSFLEEYTRIVDWDLKGLQTQVLDTILALLVDLRQRHNGTFWRLRGRPLMIRVVCELLENPIAGVQKT